jgi:hypothetical protein
MSTRANERLQEFYSAAENSQKGITNNPNFK